MKFLVEIPACDGIEVTESELKSLLEQSYEEVHVSKDHPYNRNVQTGEFASDEEEAEHPDVTEHHDA